MKSEHGTGHIHARQRIGRPGLHRLVIGGALSAGLAALAVVGEVTALAWVALIPLAAACGAWIAARSYARAGATRAALAEATRPRQRPPADLDATGSESDDDLPDQAGGKSLLAMAEGLKQANEALRQQVQDLTQMRDVMLAMGGTFDRAQILDEMIRALIQMLHFDRGLVLLVNEKDNVLTFGAFSDAAPDADSQFLLEQLRFDLAAMANDPLMGHWHRGEPVLVKDASVYLKSRFNWAMTTLDMHLFYSVPLTVGTRFRGVVIADNSTTGIAITAKQRSMLDALTATIAVSLENARLYQMTDDKLGRMVEELTVLSRVDRELNDALSMDRVLNLVVDWLLRFTGGQAAAVALVEPAHDPDDADADSGAMCDRLRFVTGYGYDDRQWAQLRQPNTIENCGIVGRVVQTGHLERLGILEPGEFSILPDTRSQMAVPVTRENRTVAVFIIESSKINAFTEASENFALRLATRAGAAIENSRLYDETVRERRKLESILSSTADAVIVVGPDGRLVLINQTALRVFGLPPKEAHIGRAFDTLFAGSPLVTLFQQARQMNTRAVGEIALSESRVFHVSIDPTAQVGWSIVMHDVTPFKETDQLKNELLATTSHDLKNPLGSILGYVDLINMTNPLNPQGLEYMRRVQRAVQHMRNLIDDLLDMARIESGIKLDITDVSLSALVREVVQRFDLDVRNKQMTIEIAVPDDLPPVPADERRLGQIVGNILSNAIKYTPPEGHIVIRAEQRSTYFYIAIQDNGLGISPDDQAQVFSRFYRVRTPDRDNIEGTGLGLAIVKSLVEAHGGQVGLESRLGEGSTFYFTVPVTPPSQV